MSESHLPEPGPEPAKKRGRARLIDPLISSVPTLVGVLVGAVTSHFAEVQRVDFEREDRFRHEQVERVAAVAHAYDSLTEPLTAMLSAIQTQQPALCQYMPKVAAAEIKLRDAGLLHGRQFSPGAVDPNDTAEYGREVDALANAADPDVKKNATLLQLMIGTYTAMLATVGTADAQFTEKRAAFQATLMFEVKVYFPGRIRKDISSTVRAFYDIERRTASVQAPNRLCTLDANALSSRLNTLSVGGAREMTGFAQTLEPELGGDTGGDDT